MQREPEETDFLKMLGFKAMLCWHYLLLFSPVMVVFGPLTNGQAFFERQLVLYIALAMAFVFCVAFSRTLLAKGHTFGSRAFIGTTGLIGIVSMVLCTPLVDCPWIVRLIATAFAALSEAALMALWLHFYVEAAKGKMIRAFSVDMVISGLISIIICNLMEPVIYIVVLCLPAVAAVALVGEWGKVNLEEDIEFYGQPRPHAPRNIAIAAIKVYVPVALFAMAFGFLQGSYLAEDAMPMMAMDSGVLLGIVLAAVIMLAVVAKSKRVRIDIDLLHRLSLLLFVAGTVGLSIFAYANGLGGSESQGRFVLLDACSIALLAGFNLFDFGLLALSIDLRASFRSASHWLTEGSRCLVYIAMALGLLAGRMLTGGLSGELLPGTLFFACGAAVVVVVASMLMPSSGPGLLKSAGLVVLSDDEYLISRGVRSCPRGVALVDDESCGENAQCENCPVRAGVEAAEAPSVASLAQEASEEQIVFTSSAAAAASCDVVASAEATSESEQSGQPPSAAQQPAPAAAPSAPPAPARTEQRAAAQQDEAAAVKKDAPWKAACKGVAELYGLTKRESEILLYVAKGRNAVYIQNELVLSIHTVKTHIASIYKKMDVHSSQELISLIEEYRDSTLGSGGKK
ncbi:MAG: response regulator transcription factor [Coriobacteriales bacterium]